MKDLRDIGFYTMSDDRVEQVSETSPFWRCEILLTNKCNFKCPYCRDIQNPVKKSVEMDEVMSTLKFWCDNGLKNVRFSGGEPTLYPKLRELVKYCKERGVERIALSTNGSNKLEYYLELIELGVNDFSISLDACCSSFGEKMSGGVNVWEKVVENIRELSKRTYTTVGMVYNELNIEQAKESVEFAKGLGVSDIRVITAAQYTGEFDVFNQVGKEKSLPILNYRIDNFKNNRQIRGLTETDSNRCGLVIDDMAVRDNKHYPCIIYLREGGAPIGDMSGDVRKDRMEWAENHDTHKDEICRKNCLDVCCDYNNKYRKLHG